MRVSSKLHDGAQYTALVDILFATIGVFVIVFALQDINAPEYLQPTPYDHLILCDAQERLTYQGTGGTVQPVTQTDLDNGHLHSLLAGGGRVLVGLSQACASASDGSIAQDLRNLEDKLSQRPATGPAPLTLFEYAPLGAAEHSADGLTSRFLGTDRP